jgi:hypothetical protein
VVFGIARHLRLLIRRLIHAHIVDTHAVGEDEVLEAACVPCQHCSTRAYFQDSLDRLETRRQAQVEDNCT